MKKDSTKINKYGKRINKDFLRKILFHLSHQWSFWIILSLFLIFIILLIISSSNDEVINKGETQKDDVKVPTMSNNIHSQSNATSEYELEDAISNIMNLIPLTVVMIVIVQIIVLVLRRKY